MAEHSLKSPLRVLPHAPSKTQIRPLAMANPRLAGRPIRVVPCAFARYGLAGRPALEHGSTRGSTSPAAGTADQERRFVSVANEHIKEDSCSTPEVLHKVKHRGLRHPFASSQSAEQREGDGGEAR